MARQRGSIAEHGGGEPTWKRTVVDLWYGDRVEQAICIKKPTDPPSILCLDSNRKETLLFMKKLRAGLFLTETRRGPAKNATLRRRGKGRKSLLNGYIDFSKIEEISPAAAVILASEYDRARRIKNRIPPTVNLDAWSEAAFKSLYEVGFFEIVGLVNGVSEIYRATERGEKKIMAMMSGENGNPLAEVSAAIHDLTQFIYGNVPVPPKILAPLNSAVGEAMINVSRHAYGGEAHLQNGEMVRRWWFAAQADRAKQTLTAVIFDHGVTIPVTLPVTQRSWRHYLDMLPLATGIFNESTPPAQDAAAIRHAMREGTTQTAQAGRGKGLPQMCAMIGKYGAGKLTVMSRQGMFVYTEDAGTYSEDLTFPLGGTLVEWEIEVPRA